MNYEFVKKMNKKISDLSHITTKEMKEAIKRSGYLLEDRIWQILNSRRYYVEANVVFPDPETKKSREIDIRVLSAVRVYKKGYNFIYPVLLCECVNNSQPIVFFTRRSPISFLHHYEVKASGIPIKFWQKNGFVSLSDFTKMERFHHYCKGPIATQYCSFQLKKDRSSWMALHSEEQHNIFDSLIKSLEYEIDYHYNGWVLPKKIEEEEINIHVYYPLVVLQGELYSASLRNSNLNLKARKHIQFRKEVFLSNINEVKTYQIDVISEEHLQNYLKIIESEIERIKIVLQRKRANVLVSIAKIINETKRLRYKKKSYREYFEF